MSENYRKGSVDDSPLRHLSTTSRNNLMPSSVMYNVSSSPNITNVVHSNMESLNSCIENAQSEPTLQSSDFEQNGEVDNIELIFTTEETKDSEFKEALVPIGNNDVLPQDTICENLRCATSDLEQNLSDRELEDEVFHESESQDVLQPNLSKKETSQIYNSKSDNSINHEEKSLMSCYSYQDSSFENKSMEKDESIDHFEECSRIIETDISKCGVVDLEYISCRRNTCPNPLSYRPIIHREALGRVSLNTRKGRPILTNSNNERKESETQTDISALPTSLWSSESNLAHKVKGEHFAALPSKFPLPGPRLRLSEKVNIEARRVLLSDIGFTSMIPELSRSADYLCPQNPKIPISSVHEQFLRTPDLYSPSCTPQKYTWGAATSPAELSQLNSHCNSMHHLTPLIPSRRFSAPTSPSKKGFIKSTPSKVRFANGSLPELKSDWSAMGDSEDSTDSLLEEAENYLRRSIDCIVSDKSSYREMKTKGFRRSSAPEPSGDSIPPPNWHPFLPRNPRDLHLDYWVKVIIPEGKIRGGRVRYIGLLLNQLEQYVGVQLRAPEGNCDGVYSNRRYFNCEPYHGIFVPFKKVVMGWRP